VKLTLLSESHRFCDRVQDAYTLRCSPQVHGIVTDTVDFVRGVLTTEINSATDNPVSFSLLFISYSQFVSYHHLTTSGIWPMYCSIFT